MEGKTNRGHRGGSWKRGGGGRGGGNEVGSSGEHRGRGRGGHRGRGKRDHYRGRGGTPAASGFYRVRDETSKELEQEEEEDMEVFSRRKLESNWDRYEESEKELLKEDDMPTQRGTDFHVLLESAGDSFSQFRFSEEKEWEMESLAASQFAAMFLDLAALAQSLHELPLHQRLNLEAELVQGSTPVELPTMTMAPKQDLGMSGMFKPPTSAPKGLGTSLGLSSVKSLVSGIAPQGSSNPVKPLADEMDEELDKLLCLQSPFSEPSETSPDSAMVKEVEVVQDQSVPKEKEVPVPEEGMPALSKTESFKQEESASSKTESVKQEVSASSKTESVKQEVKEVSAPSKTEPVKKELTEDDLEDWLDSMIS